MDTNGKSQTMKTMTIEGNRLKAVLAEKGIRQRTLAATIGVTRFQMSRWCKSGVHAIMAKNAEAIASAIGVTLAEFGRLCGDSPVGDREGLTVAEAEWLELYRSLPPLQQAKVRVAVEDIVSR